MENAQPDESSADFSLQPFDYHQKLKTHFKARTKTWNWFNQEKLKTQQIEAYKNELLKNTYRMDRPGHPELYALADEICKKLVIDAEVTLYQENNSTQNNAGISTIGNEAHIVLSGNTINLLSQEEMKALLAHELSHYLLAKIENEDFEITQRILLSLANDRRSEDAIIETARIFNLYTELFCDAGSLKVCEDDKVVIQTLVKMNTSLSQVNAESYLEQAREIMKNEKETARHYSHPETYIRTMALHLRAKQDPDYFKSIDKMIRGSIDLNSLDIFEQVKLQELTQQFIQLVLKPKWINTSTLLNLATQYFKNFSRKANEINTTEISEKIEDMHHSTKEYLCYVLLDFAYADGDLEGLGLAHTLQIAELTGLEPEYEKVIRKEKKLGVREFKTLKEKAVKELENITEGKEDSIYHE